MPKFTFDPRGKSPHVQLLNDNMTVTAADEDSGGVVLGSVVMQQKGVFYWEVRIEAMWDPGSSDGSIRVGIVLTESYDTTNAALGDDQESIGWWCANTLLHHHAASHMTCAGTTLWTVRCTRSCRRRPK